MMALSAKAIGALSRRGPCTESGGEHEECMPPVAHWYMGKSLKKATCFLQSPAHAPLKHTDTDGSLSKSDWSSESQQKRPAR